MAAWKELLYICPFNFAPMYICDGAEDCEQLLHLASELHTRSYGRHSENVYSDARTAISLPEH